MDEPKTKELTRAAQDALNCRRIRLFAAKNPGWTAERIKREIKIKNTARLLEKMEGMGFMRSESELFGNSNRVVWYVVPQ
jgi:hypothetical protein